MVTREQPYNISLQSTHREKTTQDTTQSFRQCRWLRWIKPEICNWYSPRTILTGGGEGKQIRSTSAGKRDVKYIIPTFREIIESIWLEASNIGWDLLKDTRFLLEAFLNVRDITEIMAVQRPVGHLEYNFGARKQAKWTWLNYVCRNLRSYYQIINTESTSEVEFKCLIFSGHSGRTYAHFVSVRKFKTN